ncbi:DUF4192 domain-containing protein [Umezawaea beigongshangensis]|uniref:DUF4192 domain-containing protein n=1 Tax=Umezawaea beigongshangensis TaxID=2780383 RepID=UPI0018F2041C|nr:DUF4192 domain-containing protein [Umezawaea beigongshangensis]
MTTTTLRAGEPAQIIAAVPHLLGFHPGPSLVLILLRRDRPERIGAALRADLPPAEGHAALVRDLLVPLRAQDPGSVVLVVFGGGERPPSGEPPPRAELVERVTELLDREGVPVLHATWAEFSGGGAPWRCYDDPACGGTLPDPSATPLAAASAAAGQVTFADRSQLAALLTPHDEEALARRAALLDAALTREEQPDARSGLLLVEDAVARVPDRREPLDDEKIVELATALSDLRVRDAALSLVCGDRAENAETLWLELTRAVPPPERAEPAVLLAFSAYARGDGAFASIALGVAEEACPEHRLCGLLRTALEHGLSPSSVREIAADAVTEARWLLAGEGEQPW